jgi:Sulfotransferase domain
MDRQFVSFPKSGRSWLRFALYRLKLADKIIFHHDGFEYNDGMMPPFDFNFDRRLERYDDEEKMIVYLHRDPRDVMVSLFHQITERFVDLFKFNGTISEFIRDPYFGAFNLQEFHSQWMKLCREGRALAISYEDCHSDFVKTLEAVLSHYHFEVEKDLIVNITKEANFENMKNIEGSDNFEAPWLRFRNGAPKVRKGKIGGFFEELSKFDIDYLNGIFNLH